MNVINLKYLSQIDQKFRSSFYRHRKLLKINLKDLQGLSLISNQQELELCKILASFGPLIDSDVEDHRLKNIHKKWKRKYPQDPRFFRMALKQHEILRKYENENLSHFLYSPEGRNCSRYSKKLPRGVFFTLEAPFKSTRKSALNHELRIRHLLRKNPLLSLKDMKDIKIKNAQAIWNRFPQRSIYRQKFLDVLSRRLSLK